MPLLLPGFCLHPVQYQVLDTFEHAIGLMVVVRVHVEAVRVANPSHGVHGHPLPESAVREHERVLGILVGGLTANTGFAAITFGFLGLIVVLLFILVLHLIFVFIVPVILVLVAVVDKSPAAVTIECVGDLRVLHGELEVFICIL